MRLHIFDSLIGLCVATAVVSCSDALVNDLGNPPAGGEASDMISFTVADYNIATRGGSFENRPLGGVYLQNSNGADSLYLNIDVADIDDASLTRADADASPLFSNLYMTCRLRTGSNDYCYYFENLLFSHSGSVWASNPPYYWLNKDDKHFTFYGYATSKTQEGVKFNGNSTDGYVLSIDFTVQEDVKNHSDLVYNLNTNEYISTANTQVPLNLKHALSKIAFKTGADMAEGTIESISITNCRNKGVLNLESGDWTDLEGTQTFSLSGLDLAVSNDTPITGDDCFMLLPGSFTDDSKIEVVFKPKDGAATTYSAPLLRSSEWIAGKQYTYTISIAPDLIIDIVPETVDAHYVIAKAHIKVPESQPEIRWKLEVQTDNGASEKVTVTDQLNEFQKLGFWTDRVLFQAHNSSNTVDNGSARGETSFSGSGSKDVYIFVPENIGNNQRDIKLNLYYKDTIVDTKIFKQNCPDWNDDFGWEHIEEYSDWVENSNGGFNQKAGDPHAPWGYEWNRKVTYRRNNIWWNYLIYGPMIKELQTQYDPQKTYTTVSETGAFQQVKIEINYSNLNSLKNLDLSDNDGLKNTKELYKYSGGAVTGELEEAVKNVDSMEIISESGNNNSESAALSHILKKNRYDLKIVEKKDGNNVDQSKSAYINASNIVWFLPSKDQMKNSPSHSVLNGNYWSSTPDGTDKAFTNSGSDARSNNNKVRACRNKP